MKFDPQTLDFRASRFADLCGSVNRIELTAKQKETLEKYEDQINSGKPLTANQRDEHFRLFQKKLAKPCLDDTAKKWVQELFREEVRRTYNSGFKGNKTTEKGNMCEQAAIDRVARVMGFGATIKSSAEFKDNIGPGHPDIYKPKFKIGADVKCSWTDNTFPLFDYKLKNYGYEIQGKRYCHLSGLTEWWIVYSLENTPEHIVIQEAQRLWKESGESGYLLANGEFASPAAEAFYEQTKSLHSFDHLADWERVKPFKVVLTDEDVTLFEKRAEMAREYAQKLFEEYQQHKNYIETIKK